MSRACLVSCLLFLLLLKLGSLNDHLGFVVGCHEAERQALLKFRQSLNDTKNVLSSWQGKDCCHWEGVGCDNVTFYVSHLDVHDPSYNPNNEFSNQSSIITSKLDRSLVELSRLKYLELSGIDFQSSPIPGFIGSFKHLRYLNLSNSNFGGIVPSQVGNLTRLHTLDLSLYLTSSSDLRWVSSLVSLRYLNLNNVPIDFSVKSTHMLNMPPLLGLQLSYCHLTVPNLISLFSNFTWLSTLQQLDLSKNDFEGSLPTVFVNLTSLRYLDLSGNGLIHGSIPLWLKNMRKLEHLDLSSNWLEGPLPHVFANMTSLTYLSLSQNNFNGSIPLWLKNMRKLEHLDLSYNLLEGPFPHVFANMTSLTYLSFSQNNFNGSIPLSIQNMGKLQYLDLSFNEFSQVEGGATIMGILGSMCKLKYFDLSTISIRGEIGAHHNLSKCANYDLEYLDLSLNRIGGTLPSWLADFTSLRILDITYNKIEGHIPVSIGSLSYLEELNLSYNNLTGTLPNSLGSLRKLIVLDVGYNRISGEIPTSFGKLSSMEVLHLSQNSLNGTIPEGLGQCKAMVDIDLSSNNLHGVVFESFFTNLSSLKTLDLSSNSLEVNLGSNWSPPFQLTRLSLRSCKIQAQFPQWIVKQTSLVDLDLSDNMMSGKLDSLFRLEILKEVNISHNQFTGPIPYFSSSALTLIDLSYNLFSGPLVHAYPSDKNDTLGSPICQLPNLQFIDLQRNNIFGTIPDCWGNSNSLVYINLSSNNLSGIIPMSMGLLQYLQFLKLSDNSLKGPIPPTLSTSSRLQILDLGENKLVGNIPVAWNGKNQPNLQMLRLRGNQLVGVIPTTLCYLPMLQFIDLAHNNLTGGVPHCFGNLMGMKVSHSREIIDGFDYGDPLDYSISVVLKGAIFQYSTTLKYVVNLDLSSNALVGSIPDEITNLSSLIGLNLSHNHLTGSIPKTIGEMTSLESLDLSNNNLSDTIPTSISDLTWLISINVSNNKLHGEIPTGNQLQTLIDPSSYEGNPGLCGDPLPNKCGTSPGRNQPQQEQEKHSRENDLENPLFYFVIISGVATGFWGVVGSLLLKNRFRFAVFQLVDKVADYLYVKVMVRLNRFRN